MAVAVAVAVGGWIVIVSGEEARLRRRRATSIRRWGRVRLRMWRMMDLRNCLDLDLFLDRVRMGMAMGGGEQRMGMQTAKRVGVGRVNGGRAAPLTRIPYYSTPTLKL